MLFFVEFLKNFLLFFGGKEEGMAKMIKVHVRYFFQAFVA